MFGKCHQDCHPTRVVTDFGEMKLKGAAGNSPVLSEAAAPCLMVHFHLTKGRSKQWQRVPVRGTDFLHLY